MPVEEKCKALCGPTDWIMRSIETYTVPSPFSIYKTVLAGHPLRGNHQCVQFL